MSGSSNALDAIAHPAVVNPLAAMAGAMQTANSVYDLRQKQAAEAAGQAFQQSIDRVTGQPNQAALMRNLANSPAAAMAAQASATSGQALDTNTWNLHNARTNSLMSSLGQLVADHPEGVPADVMHATIDRLAPIYNLPPEQVQAIHAQVSNNPRANTALVIQGLQHGMSQKDALETARPSSVMTDTGGAKVPVTPQSQAGSGPYTGAQSQAPGGVKVGPQPGDTQEYTYTPTGPDGKPTGPPVKMIAPKGSVFPGITGATIIPSPSASGPPASGTTPGAATLPPGYTGRGTPTPPNSSLANPNKAAPAQPPAPAATTPAPPAATTSTPSSTASPPGVPASAPAGTEKGIESDVTQFKQDQTNIGKWQTTDQNLGHAYEALKLTTTGRSTEATHAMYSFLNAQGALPPGMEDNVKNYDLFKKYTERIIADLGNAAGTDQGRQLAAASNAGTSFSTAANMEIMRNDIAKNRQQLAAIQAEDQKGTGYGYGARRGSVMSNTDPRGFAWNLYTPDEQAKINKEVEGNKTAADKLHRAIGMADALHLDVTPGQTPAGRPSPPAGTGQPSVRRPQAMIAPQNALAAYG